jgi:hypothetical protein
VEGRPEKVAGSSQVAGRKAFTESANPVRMPGFAKESRRRGAGTVGKAEQGRGRGIPQKLLVDLHFHHLN